MTPQLGRPTPDDEPGFAEKLGYLFEHSRDENGAPYTGKKIAERANDLGYSLSDAYISQLRTGKARTPSFRTVEAIARAFEVSVTYFLANPDEDLERVRQQRDYVEMLATTGTHLSGIDVRSICPDTIDVVIALLKMVKAQAVETQRTPPGEDSGQSPA
ncbi:helix-turn-helix domain-containing protein [Gordonia hankookensis]|uniref:Helix-turn-helix transcriptional regulator n=1 Tax=Gordonia hankookensis TaxID=589403 RepID=A0ABR7WB96_9ACTN|nr:helix-turn-helix transcriptional regulator [Gordonia hankookensis]MBD1319062.1 helix-turn-helix transcriptional regulator [Gordonia hankookensis]NDZ93595.1 helix-turn-helix transcriptional regulator [Streptomyces sp. SID11726]NEB27379.1 helix-turn-helix transcriptional regulator [Streptomyces sp. SID6673]